MSDYVPVAPRRMGGNLTNYGGESGRKSREFYKNADKVPEMCRTCDHNYRESLRGVVGENVGLYDIDIVLEANKRILAVGEYKRYKQDYQEFLIPSFEFVALKKIAKLMRVSALLLIEVCNPGRPSYWYAWEIDRFETDRQFKQVIGKTWAAFNPATAKRLDSAGELGGWLQGMIVRLQGAV